MHPYENLPQDRFWRTAVADPGAEGLTGLWKPKFRIAQADTIVTAGSCFAQHIGRALSARGYGWTDFEPAPPYLSPEVARDFGYGTFSFRTGNIYTPFMLAQWLDYALGQDQTQEVWNRDGKYFDPIRPAIEPGGFASRKELDDARVNTIAAIRKAVTEARIFVFTLGLTESWRNRETGLEYALCPGTVAGSFDPELHEFVNTNLRSTYRNLVRAIRLLRKLNARIRVLLTVSPVPLTATASGQHVLTATSYSKSVLRAAAGLATEEFRFVDYFPSYEIITHPVFGGRFFAENLRSVRPEGVECVMHHFFNDQSSAFGTSKTNKSLPAKTAEVPDDNDVRCEEELLDAFAR